MIIFLLLIIMIVGRLSRKSMVGNGERENMNTSMEIIKLGTNYALDDDGLLIDSFLGGWSLRERAACTL